VTAAVEYADYEPNGLAVMIGGLLEGNLVAHPAREKLLRPGAVGIVASDAAVGLTLRFGPGTVTVANGITGDPDVIVRTDSTTLTELTAVPLRFGMPDPLTREGRAVTRKVLSGDLKVRGLLLHARTVSRLNRLLSVR
jgi:hypothetical protein